MRGGGLTVVRGAYSFYILLFILGVIDLHILVFIMGDLRQCH